MNYQYWVIRFVPNVARGEFTNIGIVCGRDDGDWAVRFDARFVRNHGQLSSDLRELSSWIRWFSKTIGSHAVGSLEDKRSKVRSGWIEHLRARQANSIQFSPPAPVEVESARGGVGLLFPHLVEREGARRRTSITRRRMRSEIRDVLVHGLEFTDGVDLFVQPRFSVGKQNGSFDLALKRASVALTNVWAFNVSGLEDLERDIQSWNFLVSRLRDDGALIANDRMPSIEIPSNAPIEVVVDPPSSSRDTELRQDIFEAAKEAWAINHVNVRAFEEYESELSSEVLTSISF